jgi:hypothetical protein
VAAADSVETEDKRGKKHKKHKKQGEAPEAPPQQPPEAAAATEPAMAAAAEKPAKHDVRLKARVFALAEVSHRRERVFTIDSGVVERDRDALDLSLLSARIGAEYRSPLRWLTAELELELSGNVRPKDAYVQAGKSLFVRAGQFKVPAAALEIASPWTLPLARRGLVHDLMADWMDVAGRAPGVAVGYRSKEGLKPRLMLGAFQGSTLKSALPGDRDVRLLDRASLSAQTYAGRAEIAPFGVAIGAWFEQRVGSVAIGQFAHYATFGLDATVDQRFENGGLRLWVDGSAGEGLYEAQDKPESDGRPWFVAGRALAAYRFGGTEPSDPYVEPFGFFAAFDPDTEVVADLTTEAAVGLVAGFWDRARVTLQGELTHGRRNFPAGFLAGQSPSHRSLLLQAGARF